MHRIIGVLPRPGLACLLAAVLFGQSVVPFLYAAPKPAPKPAHRPRPARVVEANAQTITPQTTSVTGQETSIEAAVVRHAPSLNSARVEGSIRPAAGDFGPVTVSDSPAITHNESFAVVAAIALSQLFRRELGCVGRVYPRPLVASRWRRDTKARRLAASAGRRIALDLPVDLE